MDKKAAVLNREQMEAEELRQLLGPHGSQGEAVSGRWCPPG